jgi:hypothetical protein
MTERDPREAKLPLWAQQALRDARTQLVIAQQRASELDDEMEMLKGVIAKRSDELVTSDTVLIANDEDATRVPLGDRADIEFDGCFLVHYGDDEGGKTGLVITANTDMLIRPTYDPRTVLIVKDAP